MYGLTLITPPATEPLTLEDAKLHLREDGTAQDALITSLIKAAREHVEGFLGRALVTQTWDLTLDGFPSSGEVLIPRPPLVSVTSVKYLDAAGVQQTMTASDYVVDVAQQPGRVFLAYGANWPTIQTRQNAVVIRFVAGYGAAASVPESIKAAVKLLVGHWYENREAAIVGTSAAAVPMAVESLLWMERTPEAFV